MSVQTRSCQMESDTCSVRIRLSCKSIARMWSLAIRTARSNRSKAFGARRSWKSSNARMKSLTDSKSAGVGAASSGVVTPQR